jgi:hypothetical protein
MNIQENFRKSFLYGNRAVVFEGQAGGYLTSRFLPRELLPWLQQLKVEHFIPLGGPRGDYQLFCQQQGVNIPENKYRVLLRACENLENRLRKLEDKDKKCESIAESCNKKLKLSRWIRHIWGKDGQAIEIPNNIKKFAENTECIINMEDSIILNSLWDKTFWDNSMKTFIFKLLNNTLGYNYTVTKHAPNVDKDCTFCILEGRNEESSETPLHLFYSCPTIEPILEGVYQWIQGGGETVSRQDFFGVPKIENFHDRYVSLLINIILKKWIWDGKQRGVLPNLERAKKAIIDNLKVISKINRKTNRHIELGTFKNNIHELQ